MLCLQMNYGLWVKQKFRLFVGDSSFTFVHTISTRVYQYNFKQMYAKLIRIYVKKKINNMPLPFILSDFLTRLNLPWPLFSKEFTASLHLSKEFTMSLLLMSPILLTVMF